jgi:hypothetical protein
MKKERTEELFVKWMDGVLTPEEESDLSELLTEDAALENELAEMKSVSAMISREVKVSEEPPYGDFFNSQLMRKVDLEIEAKRPAKRAERWWNSLGWAWAPVGALALVLSFFAGHRLGHPAEAAVAGSNDTPKIESIIMPTVYSAGDSLDAEVIAGADGQVSAIVVNGITAIRDDIDFGAVTSHEDLPETYKSAEGRRFD